MVFRTLMGAAALAVVAAGTSAALGAPPQQQAAPQRMDDLLAKQRQLDWEYANGMVPGEGDNTVLRGPCSNSVTRAPGTAIADLGTITDVMTTTGTTLLNVKAQLIITHTWQGDIIARLRHDASGTEVTLIDRPGVPNVSTVGFSADNFGNNTTSVPFVLDDAAAMIYDSPQVAAPGTNNVTGSWKPDTIGLNLAAFNGLTANTTWTLTVSDNAGGDTGVLRRWTLCWEDPTGTSNPTGIGSASPATLLSGASTTLSVAVTPGMNPTSTGLAVVADLTNIGGSPTQQLFDNGTNGDDFAGDNVFKFATTVTSPVGTRAVNFTVSDAQARSSNGSFNIQVQFEGDSCPGPVVTAPSSTAGTTVGLLPSGNLLCGVDSADAFYRFTPIYAGEYTIDTCGSSFDTRLSVFTDCPALTMIGCNDDACGLQSRLVLTLAAGTTYHIRVSAFGAATTGAFVLNISAPPIPTGGCCIASVCTVRPEAECIAAGGSYRGDNTNCESNGTSHDYSSTPFLAIPDNTCATTGFVSDSLNVPDNFVVGDVNVRVQITHTFIGDLRIRLLHGATTVAVWERACLANDNMDVTFDDEGVAAVCASPTVGTYTPTGTGAGSLSSFDGQSSSGTWTLEVCDGAGIDTGTLDSWTLTLREQGSVCGPAFCDADWCRDGSVGVPDIFCFLSDWFAFVPAARCYGGTCGVPAIFSFLSIWFATGQGPCTP